MWCFFFEMILKLLGLGFKEYARDSFNLFDAILVVVSLIEYCLTMAGLDQLTGGALSSLRGVRLLRVFKLARSWKSFRELLMKMFLTLKDVRTFSVLLSIFIFIFMLLGMELFGHKIKFNSNGEPINSVTRINKSTEANKSGNYHNLPDGEGVSPRANFDTWYNGFITIFIVFVGDDWNSIMYDHYRNLYE
jgi:voltage-dependent calcium channel L type alpha-1D